MRVPGVTRVIPTQIQKTSSPEHLRKNASPSCCPVGVPSPLSSWGGPSAQTATPSTMKWPSHGTNHGPIPSKGMTRTLAVPRPEPHPWGRNLRRPPLRCPFHSEGDMSKTRPRRAGFVRTTRAPCRARIMQWRRDRMRNADSNADFSNERTRRLFSSVQEQKPIFFGEPCV